jgi:putative ABC transport system permease protein
MWMDDARRDTRQALRMWVRNPAFSLVAILTLALGVGANSAIFSIVHAVLLRPLPYADGERLVRIVEQVPAEESVTGQPERVASMAVDEFVDWRTRTQTLAAMAMYAGTSMTLTGQGTSPRLSSRLKGARVSAALLPMLGLRSEIGRLFEPREERRGTDAVVVLAHGAWQR